MDETSPALPVLIGRDRIATRIEGLGDCIARDFPSGDLLLVGVLKGSFVFLADLVRAIPRPVRVDFIGASSYGEGTTSSGQITLTNKLSTTIRGADVLVVEDIVDTGITLEYILNLLAAECPRSLGVVSLLDKPARHERPVKIDYLGFEIPDRFVVGYGMDHAERYRDLADICVVED